ncbi:hypothetical protein [Microcoleus sp. Pol12A6]|uniref:hypothetical protein n=2 Tax=unclassified Microcoleus TaxID=2642155 RepID=UPI002FD4E5D3
MPDWKHERIAMVQLTETGDRTSRLIRAIVPTSSLASFAVSEALEEDRPAPIRIVLAAGASVNFDGMPKTLTSEGDICYGASAISGLNLHFPSSKS